MSAHPLADLAWKVHEFMRTPDAQEWLTSQCDNYLRKRKEDSKRPPPMDLVNKTGDPLTLDEKCAILVALHGLVCTGEKTLDPTPLRDMNGVRWAALVVNVQEKLGPQHRHHVESWLKDMAIAFEAEHKPPSGALSSGPQTREQRQDALNRLEPAQRKAYLSYELAESQAGQRLEDRDAYELLKEQGIPDDRGDLGDLTDYKLPAYDTWTRQLREARRALGEQKHTSRARRRTGKSIVKSDQIEGPKEKDR